MNFMASPVMVYNKNGDVYKKYSVKDFVGLDEVPKDCMIDTLDLCGSDLTTLPRNIRVLNSVDLSHTKKLKEIPGDIQVGGSLNLLGSGVSSFPTGLAIGGDLYLGNSAITHLPDVTVRSALYLVDSQVLSIGPNVNAHKLVISSTDFLTNAMTCYELVVSSNKSDLDFSAIQASRTLFRTKDVKYHVRNLQTKFLIVNGVYTDFKLSQSKIEDLRIQCGNIVLDRDVCCETLTLGNLSSTGTDQEQPITHLDLNGAQIENLTIGNFNDVLVPIDRLVVSNLVVNRRRDTLLPENCLVYGNATLHKNTVVPTSFCCLGEVNVRG